MSWRTKLDASRFPMSIISQPAEDFPPRELVSTPAPDNLGSFHPILDSLSRLTR